MILISSYEMIIDEEWGILIECKETCLCPKCGALLKYRDRVKRGQKQIGGECDYYRVNRVQCSNKSCRSIHRQLPDFMVPYKQYTSEIIEDVIDGVVSEEDAIDYPCVNSMKLWKNWFFLNYIILRWQVFIERKKVYNPFGITIKTCVMHLQAMREAYSPGWLGQTCLLLYNTGKKMVPFYYC